MKLRLGQIAEFMAAEGEFDGNVLAQGYSLDSRTIAPGELFFAVRGERLDGHDYVESALAQGAAAAVVAHSQATRFNDRSRLMVVEDTLTALQTLGRGVRNLWGHPLIGVTGSAGKTTAKELIAYLLGRRYRVLKSEGNLNNHFGLPMQLLRLEPEHELAVIEMGMSHAGEITALARIAQPSIGVVTNVAPVHLGFFKSVAEIARAKQELVRELPPDGIAVLNADDEYVSRFGDDFPGRVITYAIRNPADVRAESLAPRGVLGSTFEVIACSDHAPAELRLIGLHNVYNALAAVAVARACGIPLAEAAEALAEVAPVNKRGQVLEIGGATVVNDCYNSNPRALDSMIDAVAAMAVKPGGRRIVVAGEMLELGPTGEELHRRCGAHLAEKKIDVVVGVRGAARFIVEAARQSTPQGLTKMQALFVESPEQAGEWLAQEVRAGDLVLLKASRGVRLEKALETWQAGLVSAAENKD